MEWSVLPLEFFPSNYGFFFLSVVNQANSFWFATNQGKARPKDNIREGMVGHQIVVSRPYCSKNGALWRMRRIGQLSGFSAEHIEGRSYCLFARIPWLQRSWNYIETNRPFAVDPHEKKLSIFGTGRSACLTKVQFTSEHFSEPIGNHVIPNKLSNLNLYKKHLQKRHRIFRRDREPNSIPTRTLQGLGNKSRRVREFVFNCICSSTPKSSRMHCHMIILRLWTASLNSSRKYSNV